MDAVVVRRAASEFRRSFGRPGRGLAAGEGACVGGAYHGVGMCG